MADQDDSEREAATTPEKKLGFASELEVIDTETGLRHNVIDDHHIDDDEIDMETPTPIPMPASSIASARPEWYEELTEEQIGMFKEMFEMLDKDGGGTLDAAELCKVMAELDIEVSKDEVVHVLSDLDKDGNGEIDFDEFLYAMSTLQHEGVTDTQADGEEGSYSRRQRLFFTAITRFAMKNSMGEIERYYSNRMRQAPHVISFYTAGVRLIGLNDRQLELCLRNMQKTAQDQDSPYAKPLPFVTPRRKKTKDKKKKAKRRASASGSPATPTRDGTLSEPPAPTETSLPGGRGGEYAQRSSSIDGRLGDLEHTVQKQYQRRRSAMTPDSVDLSAITRLLRELAERGSVMAKLPDVHLIPAVRNKLGQMIQNDPQPNAGDQRRPLKPGARTPTGRRQTMPANDISAPRRQSTAVRRASSGSSGGEQTPAREAAPTPDSSTVCPDPASTKPKNKPCCDEDLAYSNQRGWMIPRINLGMTLPVISISSKTNKKFTVEDVPAIRARVSHALIKYYSQLKRAHVKLLEHSDMDCTIRNIRSETLRENFRKVICAYTPQQEDNIYVISPWRPAPRYTSRQAGKPLSQYLAPPPSTIRHKSYVVSKPFRRPGSTSGRSTPSGRPGSTTM